MARCGGSLGRRCVWQARHDWLSVRPGMVCKQALYCADMHDPGTLCLLKMCMLNYFMLGEGQVKVEDSSWHQLLVYMGNFASPAILFAYR